MSSHDLFIKCKKCRKEAPMRDMCYDPNGKDLICKSCSDSANNAKKNEKREAPKSVYYEEAMPKKTIVKEIKSAKDINENPEKQRYYCLSCKYTFHRHPGLIVNTCPYCNKPSVKKYTAKSSNDLLATSENVFDEE